MILNIVLYVDGKIRKNVKARVQMFTQDLLAVTEFTYATSADQD
jgi:hypothetical protein